MSNNLVIFLLIQKPTNRADSVEDSETTLFPDNKRESVLSSEASAICSDKYPVTEMKSTGKVVLCSYSATVTILQALRDELC